MNRHTADLTPPIRSLPRLVRALDRRLQALAAAGQVLLDVEDTSSLGADLLGRRRSIKNIWLYSLLTEPDPFGHAAKYIPEAAQSFVETDASLFDTTDLLRDVGYAERDVEYLDLKDQRPVRDALLKARHALSALPSFVAMLGRLAGPNDVNAPIHTSDEEVLYHATTKLTDLLTHGFREEWDQSGGLGGSRSTSDYETPGVSMTGDLYVAKEIARSFREVVGIANGEYDMRDMLTWARDLGVTPQQLFPNERHSPEQSRDRAKRLNKQRTEYPSPRHRVFDVYKKIMSYAHLEARTRYDARFFQTSLDAFRGIDPQEIGVLKVRVDMTDPALLYASGEREYRVPVRAIKGVEGVISDTRRASADLDYADVAAFADQVREDLGLHDFEVFYRPARKELKLSSIIVPRGRQKQGLGSEAMRRLNQFADAHGLRVTLDAAVRDDNHGTTSQSRLVKFYRKHDYVRNRGRNKDYSISEMMYREPKTSHVNVVDEAPESHDDAFWDTKQPGRLDSQDTAFPAVTDNDDPRGADPWADARRREGSLRGNELGDLTENDDEDKRPRRIDDFFRLDESYSSENQFEDPNLKLGQRDLDTEVDWGDLSDEDFEYDEDEDEDEEPSGPVYDASNVSFAWQERPQFNPDKTTYATIEAVTPEGDVVGAVMIMLRPNRLVRVVSSRVEPSVRGQGVGKGLYKAVLDWARDEMVWVSPDIAVSEDARKLWRKWFLDPLVSKMPAPPERGDWVILNNVPEDFEEDMGYVPDRLELESYEKSWAPELFQLYRSALRKRALSPEDGWYDPEGNFFRLGDHGFTTHEEFAAEYLGVPTRGAASTRKLLTQGWMRYSHDGGIEVMHEEQVPQALKLLRDREDKHRLFVDVHSTGSAYAVADGAKIASRLVPPPAMFDAVMSEARSGSPFQATYQQFIVPYDPTGWIHADRVPKAPSLKVIIDPDADGAKFSGKKMTLRLPPRPKRSTVWHELVHYAQRILPHELAGYPKHDMQEGNPYYQDLIDNLEKGMSPEQAHERIKNPTLKHTLSDVEFWPIISSWVEDNYHDIKTNKEFERAVYEDQVFAILYLNNRKKWREAVVSAYKALDIEPEVEEEEEEEPWWLDDDDLEVEAAGTGLDLSGNPNDWGDGHDTLRSDMSVDPYGGRDQNLGVK